MKPSRNEVTRAITTLKSSIPFFPPEELAQAVIAEAVLSFVEDVDKLGFWLKKCVELLQKYEGVPQLRAVYSIWFRPADGIAATVEIPGYTAANMETMFRAREMEENSKRLEAYRAEKLLAPPGDSAPLLLPELKSIPHPGPREFERCFWCLVESPKATWDLTAGECPKCQKLRPTIKEREQHLANTKTMPRDEAERRSEVSELNRILGLPGPEKPETGELK
jgi:hypothetical protein